MARETKPLYRKENTRARGSSHRTGGDFRHERGTERSKKSDALRGPMRGRDDRGLDARSELRLLHAHAERPSVHAKVERASVKIGRCEGSTEPFHQGQDSHPCSTRLPPRLRSL